MGGVTSCDKFLDTLPDNRTELNSTEKIQKLLVSANASRTYVRFFEYASDNCELYSEGNKNTSDSLNRIITGSRSRKRTMRAT